MKGKGEYVCTWPRFILKLTILKCNYFKTGNRKELENAKCTNIRNK